MSEVPNVPKELEIVPGVGNTITTPSPAISPAKNWFFTFNNYTEDEMFQLEQVFKSKCSKYYFQEEIGANGTPHLQGSVSFSKKIRPLSLHLSKCIHWEKTRNSTAADEYANKQETRKPNGHVFSYPPLPKPIKLIDPNRPFQKFILNLIQEEPDERIIYWFWESVGNVGKSSFVKYVLYHYKALFIDEGKKADIACHMAGYIEKNKNAPEIVLIDVPRANKNKISYKSVESIKNGVMFSAKYESSQLIFNAPHIVIFANYPPDITKLSKDRWEIYKINESYEHIRKEIILVEEDSEYENY